MNSYNVNHGAYNRSYVNRAAAVWIHHIQSGIQWDRRRCVHQPTALKRGLLDESSGRTCLQQRAGDCVIEIRVNVPVIMGASKPQPFNWRLKSCTVPLECKHLSHHPTAKKSPEFVSTVWSKEGTRRATGPERSFPCIRCTIDNWKVCVCLWFLNYLIKLLYINEHGTEGTLKALLWLGGGGDGNKNHITHRVHLSRERQFYYSKTDRVTLDPQAAWQRRYRRSHSWLGIPSVPAFVALVFQFSFKASPNWCWKVNAKWVS